MTQFTVLGADERAQLHERTLDVLGRIGMRVDTAAARAILQEAGAVVDEEKRLVRFPADLVARSLEAAPKHFSLGGRRPGWSFPLNVGGATLCDDGGPTLTIDRQTGARRPGTFEDWREATVLCDAIDEIGVYWNPFDIDRGDEDLSEVVGQMINVQRAFSKHYNGTVDDPAHAPWLLEILDVVHGGREAVRERHPFSFLLTPVSPLVFDTAGVEGWLALRGNGIPLAVMPMPLMGSTAPASMLSTVLLTNCEVLGALCLSQAADPGSPFIYAPTAATMDPRNGRIAESVAHSAINVAQVEMGRFYGLPVMGSGPSTDASTPGIQATYERTFGAVVGSLACPDILVGPGSLAESTIFSTEQLLIDVEVWRMCRKLAEGVRFERGDWFVEEMEKVGPGGHFMAQPSTRRNAHSGEWHLSQLGWHDTHDSWDAAGRPDVRGQAGAKIDELLATHEPLPLGEDVERELQGILARAREQG